MSRIVKPGPPRLEAGLKPGGIVLRVYSVPGSVLLLERRLAAIDDAGAVSDAAFIAALTEQCCLVAYDGDTGARMPLGDILGTPPGTPYNPPRPPRRADPPPLA